MFIEAQLQNMTKWEEFTYIFTKIASRRYKAVEKADPENVIIFNEDDENIPEAISKELPMFIAMPENLGYKVPENVLNPAEGDALITHYEFLLVGCIRARMIAAGKNPDTANVSSMLNWLESTDFFTAPASAHNHEAFPRGLVVHTLNVYNKMCELWVLPDFEKIDIHSIVLTALVHDWCKIGLYEQYMRNVKNEETGAWEKKPDYRYQPTACIGSFGHGTTSMFLANRLMKLSVEEALAIRWHMGEYNVASNEMDDLHTANSRYPLVYMIQFADRLACTDYPKQN